MLGSLALLAVAFASGACSKDTGPNDENLGLSAPTAVPAPAIGSPAPAPSGAAGVVPGAPTPHAAPSGQNPHAIPSGQNPHAIPSGQNPHAMPAGQNPHAMMPGASNPHGATGTGTPVANPHSGLGNERIDPTRYLRGVLTTTATTAALVKPGDIVFVSVKPIDPKTGELGPTVAVDRYDVDKLPLQFSLDGSDVMTTAVPFSGKVAILARVDRDGEARTALPGDVEGRVTATIPAESLELSLDRVLE